MDGATDPMTVEVWSLASVAGFVMKQTEEVGVELVDEEMAFSEVLRSAGRAGLRRPVPSRNRGAIMSNNVVTFPGTRDVAPKHDFQWRIPSPRQKLRFLSKDRILRSDEADLINDVSCNLDRARVKLGLISKRLTGLKHNPRSKSSN